MVGEVLGETLRLTDGRGLDMSEGDVEGYLVDLFDGDIVGLTVGTTLGTALGLILGVKVCILDGALESAIEGSTDGVRVDEAVGKPEVGLDGIKIGVVDGDNNGPGV